MILKGEIIAYHGWGFDRNCWKEWQEILSNNFQFQTYDRGYFQDEISPKFADNELNKIIFAHSFGLHLCPIETIKQAKLLILFNSFSEFHPQNEKPRKRSKYALKLMIDEFKNNPKTVLESFYKKCYYPSPYTEINSHNFNKERLEDDLNLLNKAKLDINILKKIPKIHIIHGSKDRIFLASYAQEFHKKVSQNSQYYEIEESGHTLPFTDLKSCLSIVNQALGEIKNHGTD
ncbi:alpha/beta hydrolase [Crocosphaera sp.]|uniref:alpha/beta fold hydrolase n=1 Tax=Crocosphaera sp. TaxID=2729996 RepID=UPI002617AAE7|nr:alpha/beta hydrolase [Crocosphaera sp.]MDJ0581831.1 alpha/beta hydrolase [Crocosphaera sp.]